MTGAVLPPESDDQSILHASTLSDDNPWPGLLAFRESDRQYFQGRRVETEALLRLVDRERLTVLFGLSGLGKSSLLQAGLFPRLRAEQVFPVYIRLDYSAAAPDLVAQVWDAVQRQAEDALIEVPDGQPGDTLWARFHRTDADFWNQRNRPVTPLLVFDQFEEIFTLGRRDAGTRAAADRLVDELSDLAEGRVPAALKQHLDARPEEVSQFVFGDHRYKILLSIREDFLPDVETLRGRLSGIALNRLRLQGMDGVAALEVVNQAPHLIDPEVAEQVVRFVAADRDERPLASLRVEPALLSVVSRELNAARRLRGEAKITPDLLKGSQDEVLANFYERSVEDLPAAARTFIEDSLLTVSGYRDSVALENALSRPELSRPVLDRLVERRLIRIDDRSGAQRVELTHDLLTGVVRTSRDRRRQIEDAERERAARVDAQTREQVALRQLHRSRQFTALFLIISMVAVGAAIWAVLSQREAARQRAEAAAAQASAYIQDGVNAMRSDRPDHALAHFASALRADPASLAARSWITNLLRRSWWVPSTPFEHPSAVIYAALSPDGRRVLAGSADGSVTLWDAAAGRHIGEPLRVQLADPVVGEAVFSPDGRSVTIVWHDASSTSGFVGSLITSVDATTGAFRGKPIASTLYSHMGAISVDGGRVLLGTDDGAVRVVDVASRAPVGQPLRDHGQSEDAAFSPDGRFVLTNNAANGWRVWEVSSGALIGRVAPWTDRLAGFTADGRFFMWTGSELHVHEAGTGTLQRSVPWSIGTMESALAVNQTGTRILSVDDSVVRVREFPDGAGQVRQFEAGNEVLEARFSHDGRWVVAVESVLATESGVRIWDAETGAPVGQTLRHGRPVSGAALSLDGRRIATAAVDGTARVWELSGGGETGLRRHPWERAGALSADGRRAATVAKDNSISIWETDPWTMVGQPLRPPVPIADVALSPDGRWLLSLDEYFDNNNSYDTRFWDLDARRETAMLRKAYIFSPTSDRFSREGGRVAVSVRPSVVDVFDLVTGKSIGQTRTNLQAGEQSERLRVSPDGRLLFTGEAHPDGLLWDLQSATPILRGAAGDDETKVVAFSPDGTRVAAATNEVVQVWDLATQRLTGKPQRNDGEVNYLAFTPDGHTIVAVYGSRAQAWDVETGRRFGEPLISESEIETIAFSSDSRRVVAAGNRSVQVWELGSTTPIGTPLTLGDTVFSALFTPDGQHVIVLAARTFVVWQVLVSAESDDDVQRLADLAEEVSGFRFNEFGSLVPPFGDDGSQRRELRDWAGANARSGGTDVASFVREFLAGLK